MRVWDQPGSYLSDFHARAGADWHHSEWDFRNVLGIATALAEAGANVVMADIQKAAVDGAAHGLSGTNKQVMPVRIDVTQEHSVLDALAEAAQSPASSTSPATMPACRCTAPG
jgi:hypothetical protein